MPWLLRFSVWYLLTASGLAASGPLYIDRVLDDRHIIVITRDGESLLLERRPDEDPVPGGLNGDYLHRCGRHIFASERGAGGFCSTENGSKRRGSLRGRSGGTHERPFVIGC